MDLGFMGNPFTWSNCRHCHGLIEERLDRGVVNGEWRCLFPRTTITHIAQTASDHAPILLDTLGGRDNRPRPFRFEAFWANDQRSIQIVETAWQIQEMESPTYSLSQRLKATKCALRRWNREVFGNIHTNIKRLQMELEMVQHDANLFDQTSKEKELSQQLLVVQRNEELLW